MEIDRIYNMDCMVGMKEIPDGSVDLVVTDPPYVLGTQGGGLFNAKGNYGQYGCHPPRKVMNNIRGITNGFGEEVLDEMVRVMKKINIYLWCSQKQIPWLLQYFVEQRGCNWDLLAWHKGNPVPSCGNKYLSDTEWCLYFREKGVPLFGTYQTKRKYWVQDSNRADNVKYGHPTVKPLRIIDMLITNSSKEGDLVMDPYMGSGTTAVACIRENRRYVGFEIDESYYKRAKLRLEEEQNVIF